MNKTKAQHISYVVPIVTACASTSWDGVVSVPLEADQVRASAVGIRVTIALFAIM